MEIKDLKEKTGIAKAVPLGANSDLPGPRVFKSCHGKYLSAQPDGRAEWNRDAAREWERILMERAGDNHVALKSVHNKYLSAQPDGRLEWNRDSVRAWETWTAEVTENGVTLKSAHNKYLSAQPDGSVVAGRSEAGPWERFEVNGAE